MNQAIKSKLRLFLELCFFGAVAGIIYQMLNEKLVDFRSIIVGMPLGAAFGIIELFFFSRIRKKIQRLPLAITILLKALIYLLIINIVSGLLTFLAGLIRGATIDTFIEVMFAKEQLILNIYTLLLYIALSFYIQINYLLGDGVLFKFLMGRYRKPVNESRIFMFLDLKSSTTLGEKLGLTRFYSLLNDFFHEISIPVNQTNAEIYQYVGDEVIFTWKIKEGLDDSNCLKIFFKIKERIYNNRKYYRDKYGNIPEFKAGLHVGEVISAQIGDVKREIVYNGDVLNTSARIQEQCNKYDSPLLVSGILLSQLNIENEYQAKKVDTVKLRGKEKELDLFSLMEY
jgi:adenylate cyclase